MESKRKRRRDAGFSQSKTFSPPPLPSLEWSFVRGHVSKRGVTSLAETLVQIGADVKFKIISNVIRTVMGTESWKVSGVVQILKALNALAPTFAAFDRLENFRTESE